MLIVGGAIVQNPFSWDIGKISLKFSGTPQGKIDEEQQYRYKPRPEIQVRPSGEVIMKSCDEMKSNSYISIYGIC